MNEDNCYFAVIVEFETCEAAERLQHELTELGWISHVYELREGTE